MKPLFGAGLQREKGIDMGDMPIANDKSDCSKCPCKEAGCDKKVRTLNCLMTRKRFDKAVEDAREKKEQESEEGVDPEMARAEKEALADMLKQAMAEAKEEDDEDGDTPQVESQNPPPSQPSQEEEEDDDDD